MSDGTLRFLTLAILAADWKARGVVCFEEPENGMHPAKVAAMHELLRDLAVDPEEPIGPENVLRQVVIATHSPVFVQLQDPNDVLAAQEATVRGPAGEPVPTLRCFPLSGSWRAAAGARSVGLGSLLAYLTQPAGAQLTLVAAVA